MYFQSTDFILNITSTSHSNRDSHWKNLSTATLYLLVRGHLWYQNYLHNMLSYRKYIHRFHPFQSAHWSPINFEHVKLFFWDWRQPII